MVAWGGVEPTAEGAALAVLQRFGHRLLAADRACDLLGDGGAVVHPQVLRGAAAAARPARTAMTSSAVQVRATRIAKASRVCVDDVAELEPAAVGGLVELEVDGPEVRRRSAYRLWLSVAVTSSSRGSTSAPRTTGSVLNWPFGTLSIWAIAGSVTSPETRPRFPRFDDGSMRTRSERLASLMRSLCRSVISPKRAGTRPVFGSYALSAGPLPSSQ